MMLMLMLVMVSGDTIEIAFLNALVQHVLRRYQKLFEILLKSCKEILCKNFLAFHDWPFFNSAVEQNQAIHFYQIVRHLQKVYKYCLYKCR